MEREKVKKGNANILVFIFRKIVCTEYNKSDRHFGVRSISETWPKESFSAKQNKNKKNISTK